jgi:F-type H+-transporting ATPase subunit c
MGFPNFATALAYSLPLAIGLAADRFRHRPRPDRQGLDSKAMGRQPEAAAKIQTAMILGLAFSEALTIYAFVTMFILSGKIS